MLGNSAKSDCKKVDNKKWLANWLQPMGMVARVYSKFRLHEFGHSYIMYNRRFVAIININDQNFVLKNDSGLNSTFFYH